MRTSIVIEAIDIKIYRGAKQDVVAGSCRDR